jgi:hypothetical protein
MIAGYAVFFLVLIAYLVSLVVRWRNLRQDAALLEQLEDEQKAAPQPSQDRA